MDEEIHNENSYFLHNRVSTTDRKRSSVMSLERGSYDPCRQVSLNKRNSLVQVMSLEGSQRNEDIYDSLLNEEKRKSQLRHSNNIKSQHPSDHNEMEEQGLKQDRKSSGNKFLHHECSCVTFCLQWFCPCFHSNHEMCIHGLCCQQCTKTKTERLKKDSSLSGCFCQSSKCENSYCKCFKKGKKCDPTVCSCQQCNNRLAIYDLKQHEHIQKYIKYSERAKKLIEEKGYEAIKKLKCSCKKSNCLKNYCDCFYYQVGCGPNCKCRDCKNTFQDGDDIEEVRRERERYGRIDSQSEGDESIRVNIEEYFMENYEREDLPSSMEFEHPNLRNARRWE